MEKSKQVERIATKIQETQQLNHHYQIKLYENRKRNQRKV
jgi:hypothetical protein